MKLFSFEDKKKQKVLEEAEVVADIDAIIQKPISFVFKGKKHLIKTVDTQTYLHVTETFGKMDALSKSKNIKIDVLVDVYAELITAVCDSITKDDVLDMTQSQVGGLLQLIIDHVTGRIESNQKKKMTDQKK